MKQSEHTNAVSGKVFEPEDIHNGLTISLYLSPHIDAPSMNFFPSEHCHGVYKPPSFLAFTTSYATGDVFGCAIDVAAVHAFCESLIPLGRKINKTGRCRSDTPDFHGSHLALSAQGEVLLKTMHQRMDNFVQSGDWIDQNVTVVDCLDHWTPAEVSAVLTSSMNEEEALQTLQSAQDAAQDEGYRIIGPVDAVLQKYESLWLGS